MLRLRRMAELRVGGFGPDFWGALFDQPAVFFEHGPSCEEVFCLGFFVVGILLWSTGVKMSGLDAAAPIAHVQYWCAWRNRASTDFVRDPMR